MEVDLGTSAFFLENAEIQLEIAAQAWLTHHGPDSSEVLGGLPEDHWITVSPDFHLSFSVSLPTVSISTSGRNNKALVQRLTRALKNAALWNQLQYNTSLTKLQYDTVTDSPSRAGFTLALGKDHGIHTSEAGLDVMSVGPPRGVTSLSLSCIQISFDFFYPFFSSRTASSPVDDPSPMLENVPELIWPESSLDLDCPSLSADEKSVEHDIQHQELDIPEVDLDNDFFLTHEPPILFVENFNLSSPTERIISMRPHGSPASSQDPTVAPDSTPPPLLAFTPLLSLTDAALRTLIHPYPTRLSAGIRSLPLPAHCPSHLTDPPSHLFALSDLAPTIFTPGYARAVAERAPLFPAIVKTLSTCLRLSGRLQGREEGKDMETELRRDVWRTMCNGLRNPEASRRLKPLRYSGDAGASVVEEVDLAYWEESVGVIEFDEDDDRLEFAYQDDASIADEDELVLWEDDEELANLDDKFEQLELFDDYEDDAEQDWIGDGRCEDRGEHVHDGSPDIQMLDGHMHTIGSSDSSQLLDDHFTIYSAAQQPAAEMCTGLGSVAGDSTLPYELPTGKEYETMLETGEADDRTMLLSLDESLGTDDRMTEMLL